MDFEWNKVQLETFEEYKSFAEQNVAPAALRLSEQNAFDHQSWAKLAKTDFWRLIIPIEYGGLGVDWWRFVAGLEGMSSAAQDGGFILTCISQAAFIRGLSIFGTERQKQKYFPKLITAELTATAIAEPHSGTDIGASQCIAQEIAQGQYQLNGEKWNISHAPTASVILTVCKIQRANSEEIAVFFIDRDSEGLSVGEAQSKMGNRTIPTSWLKFENLSLSDEDRFGELGKGIQTLVDTVSLARILDGWMGAVLIQPLLEKAMNFIEIRQSQGKPLSKHQYIQGKITDILIGQAQSRYTAMAALAQLLNGNQFANMNGSIAKITGAKAFHQAALDLVELFGSEGYLEGEFSYLLKDAIGFASVGGTEAAHRMNIFNQYRRQFLKSKKD